MGKVIDLEEERQKAQARAKELKGNGGIRIIHIMRKWEWEKGPDGRIKHPEEADKEGEPKED
jgi:hypothetical protein